MAPRPDLVLAAYAVSLGYELRGHNDSLLSVASVDSEGLFTDTLHFKLGDMHVWLTERGWRVSQLENESFAKPSASEFFQKLKHALDHGNTQWRDR